MNNTIKIIAYIILIPLVAVWLRIGFVFFYPYKPLVDIEPITILNENKEVEAGGCLKYTINVRKTIDASATVFRYLVNGEFITLPMYATHAPAGKINTTKTVIVPLDTRPGVYKLSTVYDYKVSDFPARVISVVIESEMFRVR